MLAIEWDEGKVAGVNTAGITRAFEETMSQNGAEARKVGDAAGALAGAAKKIEAVYQVPFLAHAPMEPLNATADVKPDHCAIYASTQGQSAAQQIAARVTGLRPDQIEVHTEYLGGGFGRRAANDYIGEAVEVSKSLGAPVKLTWSREDDLQQDYYRPASYAKFAGAVDADGWPHVLTSRIACPPFGGGSRTATEGVSDLAYAIPNVLVDYHAVDMGIPVSYWRSVGYSQNTFFAESFLDELAHAGGKDPVEVRRRLLGEPAAPARRAGPGGGEGRVGHPAAGGSWTRRIAGQQHRQLHRAGRGSIGRKGPAQGASRGVRGGLRALREPGHHRTADAERDRIRAGGGPQGRDHYR